MTIEISNPETEELIRVALGLEPDTRTGADLIAAMQACPYPEIDIEPAAQGQSGNLTI